MTKINKHEKILAPFLKFPVFIIVRYIMLRANLGIIKMEIKKDERRIIAEKLNQNNDAIIKNYMEDSRFFGLFNALHRNNEFVLIEYDKLNDVPLECIETYCIDDDKFVEAAAELHKNNLAWVENGRLFIDKNYYNEFAKWAKTHESFTDSAMDLAQEVILKNYKISLDGITDNKKILRVVEKDIFDVFKKEIMDKEIKLFFPPPEVNDILAFNDMIENVVL